MRRVLILGSPGSGKTTLARTLGHATGLPVVHLDALYWRSGWVEPTREEWAQQQLEAMAQPAWIMDGNYGGTIDLRLQAADAVILLDYPTRICLARALRRIAAGWGRDRPDLAAGCPERFDPAFLAYIARFRATRRAGVLRHLEQFRGRVWHLTSPKQAASLIATVTAQVHT